MADEDITLDGKPLQSLRVADLKAALEQRNLPKSGQKNTLVKRLKGALMLENLQKTSSSHTHSGLQPNSQIGEEMCQNSFIKQYLAKQQELLRQRLEREAAQDNEADESPSVPEEDEEHSEDNDSPTCVTDKNCPIPSQSRLTRPGRAVGAAVVGHGLMSIQSQESPEALQTRVQRAVGHQEPVPSPPRAVASLSVRVLGEPDRQGLPPAVPRVHEKEGTAPSQPGSAQSVLHLSRSAGVTAGSVVLKDSSDDDEDDNDDDGDDEREDDEDWGPGPGKAQKGKTVPPKPQQMSPNMLSSGGRSKRKLQVPQHIPPPQAQHSPMQLRHPTPPPSPPSNLFPLPDTPKQSPPEPDDQDRGVIEPALDRRTAAFLPPSIQMQDSDSSSGSSSPEPPAKSKPGPLSLLVHKMESEGAFQASMELSEDTSHSTAGSSSESPLQKLKRKRQEENTETEVEMQPKKVERGGQQVREKEEHCSEDKEKKEDREKERKQCKEVDMETKLHMTEKEGRGKKSQDEVEAKEESGLKEEKDVRQKTGNRNMKVVTEQRDSDSSDSDSKSDSSSQSSSSSSDKTLSARQTKQMEQTQKQKAEEEHKTNLSEGVKKGHPSTREVSEPSAAAVTEVEPDSESSVADQPASGAEPENTENRLEESTTTKAFAARKISLTNPKTSPATTDGGAGDGDAGAAAGRKRRWGSSTAVTAKKPSISITTDSLKSLIPDIKLNQEAVVDLHPEELQMSGDEGKQENNHSDEDKGLKIRRTVTQVVPGDTQENGQEDDDDDEEEEQEDVEKMEKTEKEKQHRSSRDRRKSSVSEETSESQTFAKTDGEVKKVTPRDSLVRRSISQQKSGVSVTIDDPICAVKQPSPPRGSISKIIHVTNLVRPFTLGQLKELLNRTGSVLEEGFWIDKIKSHCYVTYATTEEAVSTRNAIHGVKWPSSNPKVLSVDFCGQDELDFHKGVLKPEKEVEHIQVQAPGAPHNRLPPLMPERDRDRERERDRDREEKDREHERDRERGAAGVRDIWAEREREMERRERARGEREWDRDKIREFARPGEDGRRSRSRERERRRRERARSKERKTDKKEKGDEPPAKLLDDLFLKTKAAPCIYWLPLTEEQAAQRLLDRTERQKERERRRKEQQEEEDKKREEEKKERLKIREKDGGGGAAGNRGAERRGTNEDREREKERERGRDKEGDKRRDSGGHRPQRTPSGPGSGRRSHSRSNPRDRRR